MTTMRFSADADAGGMIHLDIPVGSGGRYDVEVVVSPRGDAVPLTLMDRGWPAGYFERVVGCIDDDTFVAPERRLAESTVNLD